MPCIKPSDGDDAYRFWREKWGKQAEEDYWKRQAAWLELLDKPASGTLAQAKLIEQAVSRKGGAKG